MLSLFASVSAAVCRGGCDLQAVCVPVQVTSSEHVDAKRLLLMVPAEAPQFLEVRALLLERLGQHQEALECAHLPCACQSLYQTYLA